MTHHLPPHTDITLSHSSLQSALQIDPNRLPQPPAQASAKKRRKTDADRVEPPRPSEPRRLRRSHEACARCRSKKIKASPCDSKHPRCTACATAGTQCHQEDRYRQTLTPRGHTERIERQLLQCDALLKRRIPGFDLNNLDDILAREGIQLDINDPALSMTQFAPSSPQAGLSSSAFSPQSEASPMSISSPQSYPYPPPGMPSAYPAPVPMHYSPEGSPYGPPPHMSMQAPSPTGPPAISTRHQGTRPSLYDMANTEALAKNFGVPDAIAGDVMMTAVDKEDLAVGSSGLSSGRDRDVAEAAPRDASKWVSVSMLRNGVVRAPSSTSATTTPADSLVIVWLPKDRKVVQDTLDAYFTRLNFHRPVFLRGEFEQTLGALYEGQTLQHDPGFVCSVYLHGAGRDAPRRAWARREGDDAPGWPAHEEFFDRALAVKPDLRVTVSSLQALILLHWYLYTERQGRTLWRLVGSLIRLAIELGLHHDPTAQGNVFSADECQTRIRLWGIVLLHDRGTSILLGRPLAIAPSDANTPRPTGGQGADVSEHFVLSAPIAEVQADIINSLYAPTRKSADAIMRHATRISKSMGLLRRQLPVNYKWFFGGTEGWTAERRVKLVQDITEDQGLTLLKIGITRVLLLRALFSSKELEHTQRHSALVDAIVTSHNIIVVHNQLIRFADIAFFVSPIPLHISAMVILYGQMSRSAALPRQVALEDVWMALDMLPSFRWRWERRDPSGAYPLIARLAERVLDVHLHQVAPTCAPVLLPERDWEPPRPRRSCSAARRAPRSPRRRAAAGRAECAVLSVVPGGRGPGWGWGRRGGEGGWGGGWGAGCGGVVGAGGAVWDAVWAAAVYDGGEGLVDGAECGDVDEVGGEEERGAAVVNGLCLLKYFGMGLVENSMDGYCEGLRGIQFVSSGGGSDLSRREVAPETAHQCAIEQSRQTEPGKITSSHAQKIEDDGIDFTPQYKQTSPEIHASGTRESRSKTSTYQKKVGMGVPDTTTERTERAARLHAITKHHSGSLVVPRIALILSIASGGGILGWQQGWRHDLLFSASDMQVSIPLLPRAIRICEFLQTPAQSLASIITHRLKHDSRESADVFISSGPNISMLLFSSQEVVNATQ
ncbi:Regulatory protein CAT8 [Grifola frondosa]|uniref:Regulatory protein CAT8 n=1 Tax=Grifola frondosa TaxID=5627 RepID=A0A1C7MNW6_GRIFR|nr:Regulatory protein CAT8 [Grifola frondosa]